MINPQVIFTNHVGADVNNVCWKLGTSGLQPIRLALVWQLDLPTRVIGKRRQGRILQHRGGTLGKNILWNVLLNAPTVPDIPCLKRNGLMARLDNKHLLAIAPYSAPQFARKLFK